MKDQRSKTLQCGCCGTGFSTWPEYTDQGQDKGYGICPVCQRWNQEMEDKEMDKLIKAIRESLGGSNLAEFNEFNRSNQEAFAMKCLDQGIITLSYK